MNEILMWIIVGIIAAACLGILIYFIIKLVKSTPEKRKQMLLEFLIEIVGLAKDQLDTEEVEQQIEDVEKMFNEKASWFLKLILLITGKSNLKELIQEALDVVLKAGDSAKGEEE